MAYSPPAGDELDFDFNDVLVSPPTNFDFHIFDIIPITVGGAVLSGVIFK